MTITIRGASDDLIEIGGDISEEFDATRISDGREEGFIAVSDGTLLRIHYDDDGIWRIVPLIYGSASYSKEEGSVERDINDVVTLRGNVNWVALAKGWARA